MLYSKNELFAHSHVLVPFILLAILEQIYPIISPSFAKGVLSGLPHFFIHWLLIFGFLISFSINSSRLDFVNLGSIPEVPQSPEETVAVDVPVSYQHVPNYRPRSRSRGNSKNYRILERIASSMSRKSGASPTVHDVNEPNPLGEVTFCTFLAYLREINIVCFRPV